MGKSLRSKRKQKLKREKRDKFKAKEIKRLKDMLRAAGEKVDGEAEMLDADAQAPVAKTAEVEKQKVAADVDMEGTEDQAQQYHEKTLKNEHGNYPVWMNRRQIKRHKKVTSKNATEGFKRGRKRKRL